MNGGRRRCLTALYDGTVRSGHWLHLYHPAIDKQLDSRYEA